LFDRDVKFDVTLNHKMRKTILTQGLAISFWMLFVVGTSYSQIANTISPADKVFGLSKFWQEVNYNFAYFHKIDHRVWDSTYKALIPQVEATKNDYEYYRLLEKFCAMLKDGHTEITVPHIEGLNYMYNTFGDYLLVLKRVDNKVIIKRTWKKDIRKFPLGSEIIEVNGLPTEQYIRDSVAPYISASTDYVRADIASSMLLRGFPGSTFSIKIKKPNGDKASYVLTHAKVTDNIFSPDPGEYLDEKARGLLEHKTLDKDLAYVALNSFSDAKINMLFDSLLPALDKARGVIIDLRFNGGGDDGIAFTILKHFIQDTVVIGSSSTIRVFNPYQKAIGRDTDVADTAGNEFKRNAWLLYHGYAVYEEPGTLRSRVESGIHKIKAPVVILIGKNTASAAEDFLVAASNQKHIVTIGEPTNGSTGKPYRFDLPGGGSARICIKKDTYPDGREFVGYGIQPDIRVQSTVQDYLMNKDVVLEAALQYFRKKR
jgi:C-terminal processing protease CtpA/Prc